MAVNPQPEDHLIFVGDYVDRGPDSRGVIARCLALEREFRCTFLRGNHELYFLQYLRTGSTLGWPANGGLSTLNSYANEYGQIDIPEEHKAFVRGTRLYLDTPNYFFVHGGLLPELTIAANLAQVDEDVLLWQRPPASGQPVAWKKTLVVGHTPTRRPGKRDGMIRIDTGCVFGGYEGMGHLTAVILPEERYVSVPYAE